MRDRADRESGDRHAARGGVSSGGLAPVGIPPAAEGLRHEVGIHALKRREGRMTRVADLTVKIFGDGADLPSMLALYRQPYIRGFTTNPTLMNKAGIRDYRAFAKEVLAAIPDRPVSFEVFSGDLR